MITAIDLRPGAVNRTSIDRGLTRAEWRLLVQRRIGVRTGVLVGVIEGREVIFYPCAGVIRD